MLHAANCPPTSELAWFFIERVALAKYDATSRDDCPKYPWIALPATLLRNHNRLCDQINPEASRARYEQGRRPG